jgi:hypothetical protein
VVVGDARPGDGCVVLFTEAAGTSPVPVAPAGRVPVRARMTTEATATAAACPPLDLRIISYPFSLARRTSTLPIGRDML